MISAVFSLFEVFMYNLCCADSILVRFMKYFIQLPIMNLCFFIYSRDILRVIPVWSGHCNDICVFVSECEFPDVSETSIGFISIDVICTSPYDYKIITVLLTYFSAC